NVIAQLFTYLKNDDHSLANYNKQQVVDYIALQLEQRQLLIYPTDDKKPLFNNRHLTASNNKSAKPIVLATGTKVSKAKLAPAPVVAPKAVVNPQSELKNKSEPTSFADAEKRLQKARDKIIENGYQSKYSDEELVALANSGDVPKERFHVRFMEQTYLKARNSNVPLSGKLGGDFKGKNGGIKYWSTTFDQIEAADTDPQRCAEILGLTYHPESIYSMVIVDTHKAVETSGAESITPTFSEISQFAKNELDGIDDATIDALYTPEYQATYNKLYNQADELGLDVWDNDDMADFIPTIETQGENKKHFVTRVELHDKLGSNEDFLGNGLTKNNNPTIKQKFGIVETLTLERTPQTLAALKGNKAVNIIETLTPIGHIL
ncbi:hypothetical protein, partial [Psychromonas antarctica]|uniref:hypothetical protein n=1 Tax=Psychromonas antarctica TaxID=67573 RepID=UPI001EE79EAE